LWRELHPHEPEQLQLAFNKSSQHLPQRRQEEALIISTMPFFRSAAEYQVQ
jgi:hypothetical protein